MATYDEQGELIEEAPRKRLGATTSNNWSFGSALYEFLNPGAVQQEQTAMGQTPQSTVDIWGTSLSDMANAASEGAQNIQTSAQNIATSAVSIGKFALAAGIIALALAIANKVK